MTLSIEWQNFTPAEGEFENKTILVTGAASGIGRALSIELAKLGATVLMLDKKSRHLEKLYDHIMQLKSTEPIILPVDLMEINPESATTLAQAIHDDLGVLNGLVHCAAELGSPSPLDQYDIEYWNMVMHTNMQAPYFLTRALLPLLNHQAKTNIVFSSAKVGREPSAYNGAFSIAFAAIEAQMLIWSQELANTSNISVNSIDPGAVRTSLRRQSHPGESQLSLPAPDVVVPAYLMLLSSKNELQGKQISIS